MEFRYKIIVSAIKLRKGFAQFMILIALFIKEVSELTIYEGLDGGSGIHYSLKI